MALDDYYRDAAGRFDDLRLDRQPEIDRFARVSARLFSGGDRVVDIGAGTGRYTAALRRLGIRVVAVDRSLHMLHQAPHGMPCVCAEGGELPFYAEVFHGCTMIMVLHQVAPTSRKTLLSESFRVVRRGGVLVIKTTSPEDLRRRTFVRFFPTGLTINLARYPSIESIVRMAADAGYTAADVEPTYSTELLAVPDVLRSIRGKHNTTLALVPNAEFVRGCRVLEAELAGSTHFRVEHFHTLLRFVRGHT